jgi:hypothetical protein
VLIEVLRELQDSNLESMRDIADRVGVQESTLDGILHMLSSKGYLRIEELSPGLDKGCIGCPMRGGCSSQTMSGKRYTLTERGKRLVSQSFS